MTEHVHHWVIETPTSTSKVSGQCRECGDTRLFDAWGVSWVDENPSWRRESDSGYGRPVKERVMS